MSIVIQGGNYTHASGEVEYSLSVDGFLNEQGNTVTHRYRVQMQGELYAASTGDLDTAAIALRAAYRDRLTQWRVLADGSALVHSVLEADTIDGIRVVQPPSFPSNRSAAYVNYLPYTITLEWEQLILGMEEALVSFDETLQFSGGGYRTGHIETAVNLPQKQLLRQHTIFRAVQSGSAVGMFFRPRVPDPIWPGSLVEPNPASTLASGKWRGRANPNRQEVAVTWQYNYESSVPLFGRPNDWGVIQR